MKCLDNLQEGFFAAVLLLTEEGQTPLFETRLILHVGSCIQQDAGTGL